MKMISWWNLLKESFAEWTADEASDQAAALAYYTLFSLAPLLVIVVAIAGLFYHNSSVVRDALMSQIADLIGKESASTVEQMMAGAAQSNRSIIASIFGVLVLLFSASAVFYSLQSMLNRMWKVESESGMGIVNMIKARFFSFALVVAVGFLLLVSLVISTAIAAINELISGYLPGGELLAHIISFVISFGIITVLFATIFKIVPDAKVSWNDVWIGAAATALLFTIGKSLIGLYLGHSSITSSYGAAGSVLVILVWVYFSAQILFMGAEFTQVYARHNGSLMRGAPEHLQDRSGTEPAK